MTELTIHPLTANFQQASGGQQRAQNQTSSGATSFGEVLEMLNPMQHLPVISHLYRAESGNDIPAVAKIIGAGLLGGVVGAVSSAAVSLIEAVSGEPILAMAGVDTPQHQPFATNSLQAVALIPSNIEPDDIFIAQPSPQATPRAEETSNPAISRLIDLRKSDIGLPEYSIEAQMRAKLTSDLI